MWVDSVSYQIVSYIHASGNEVQLYAKLLSTLSSSVHSMQLLLSLQAHTAVTVPSELL